MRALTFSVEVITIPVSDVDRALRFYKDQLGFHLDVDYSPNDTFRVVQFTPPGSACSIQIGKGLTDARVGSRRLSMRKTKEVLRLRYELGLGQRAIARSCSISQGAVHNYLKKATAAGIH